MSKSPKSSKPSKIIFGVREIWEKTSETAIVKYDKLRYEDFEKFKRLEGRDQILPDRENDRYWKYQIEVERNYVWIWGAQGKTKPWSDALLNVTTSQTTPNPRASDCAELNDQFFILYHFEKHRLYLCPNHAVFIKLFLEREFPMLLDKTLVKSVLVSEEEFFTTLSDIQLFRFTDVAHLNPLFNSATTASRQMLRDLTGIDAPTSLEITVKLKCPDQNFVKKLGQGLRKFIGRCQEKTTYSDLVIKGFDENRLKTTFNMDSITRYVEVLAQKDENGNFTPAAIRSIKAQLLEEIK